MLRVYRLRVDAFDVAVGLAGIKLSLALACIFISCSGSRLCAHCYILHTRYFRASYYAYFYTLYVPRYIFYEIMQGCAYWYYIVGKVQ